MKKGVRTICLARAWPGPSRRRGFTLLEVLMATGLLLGCVIVLAELAAIGREHANAAEDLSTAQRLCENRINEMLCGAAAVETVESEDLDEDGWTCSVTLDSAPNPDLVAVRVTVAREAAPSRRAREFSLVRWMSMPGYTPSDSSTAPSSDAPLPAPGGMP